MRFADLHRAQDSRRVSTLRWALLSTSLGLVVALIALGGPRSAPAHSALRLLRQSAVTPTLPSIAPKSSASSNGQSALKNSEGASGSTATEIGSTTQNAPLETTTTLPSQNPAPIQNVSAIPVNAQTQQGWLDGPTAISATYSFSAPQGRLVDATWSGAPTLNLSITCDGSTTTTSGSSGLSLTARGTSCSVTLSGPDTVVSTSYVITIGSS